MLHAAHKTAEDCAADETTCGMQVGGWPLAATAVTTCGMQAGSWPLAAADDHLRLRKLARGHLRLNAISCRESQFLILLLSLHVTLLYIIYSDTGTGAQEIFECHCGM